MVISFTYYHHPLPTEPCYHKTRHLPPNRAYSYGSLANMTHTIPLKLLKIVCGDSKEKMYKEFLRPKPAIQDIKEEIWCVEG